MSRRSMLRRRSREIALQLIYMSDMRPDADAGEALEFFPTDEALELFHTELAAEESDIPEKERFPLVAAFDLKLTDDEQNDVLAYARKLYDGVRESTMEIEDIISVNMESRWRPERLVSIDRAIISLAVYEGILSHSVPVSVAISEAVDMAKTFGTEESGRFVNGVLGRIARSENETQKQ